jgi:LysM repeat protein
MADVTLRIRFNGTRLVLLGALVLVLASARRFVSRRPVIVPHWREQTDDLRQGKEPEPSAELAEDFVPAPSPVFIVGPRPAKDTTDAPTHAKRSRRRGAKGEVALAAIAVGAYIAVFGVSFAGGDAPDLLHLRSSQTIGGPVVSEVLAANQTSAVSAAGEAPAPFPTVDSTGTLSSKLTILPTPAPTPSPEPAPAGPITHVLQRGETLTSLAALYGVSIQEIASANHLTTDLIYAGQSLLIPQP